MDFFLNFCVQSCDFPGTVLSCHAGPRGGDDVFWRFCARHEAAPRSGSRNRLGGGAFCAFRLAPRTSNWAAFQGLAAAGRGNPVVLLARLLRRPNRLMSESTTLSLLGDNMLKMTHLAALAAFVLVAIAATVGPDARAQGQAAPSATPAAPAAPAAAPAAPADAGAATATAPAAPAGAKTTEMVDNPYGLQALWQGGDLVARITLAILVIMSVGSWYVIVTKVYEQAKMGGQARQAEKSFWRAPSVRQGAEGLKKSSPVSLHRRIRAGGDEHAHRAAGQCRPQYLDQHVDPARD